MDNSVHFITHYCNCILSEQIIWEHSSELIIPNKRLEASIEDVNLRGSFDYLLVNFSTLSNKGSFQTKWPQIVHLVFNDRIQRANTNNQRWIHLYWGKFLRLSGLHHVFHLMRNNPQPCCTDKLYNPARKHVARQRSFGAQRKSCCSRTRKCPCDAWHTCLACATNQEEAAPNPAWEAVASDESNPSMQPNTDAGIETPEMKSQPDIPQEEQPVRKRLQIRSRTTTASYWNCIGYYQALTSLS